MAKHEIEERGDGLIEKMNIALFGFGFIKI